jgi:hypothetical protein
MTMYAVDSKRQSMVSTGIVNEVLDWVDGDNGKRKPGKDQSRDENTGMPLWDVEVLYRQISYGRESNTTAPVRVGSPVKPVLHQFAPVEFRGLVAEVRVGKSGGVVESWKAEELVDEKAGATSPTSASGKPSAA